MNSVLEQLYTCKEVEDAGGNRHEVHSHVSRQEGERIQRIIRRHDVRRSLEVGCAFGLASLHICEALSENKEARHIIVDPNQKTEWHGVGLHSLERAGFDNYEFIEEPSEIALPKLLERGRRFDFALIDGWHTFDHTLLDLFYVTRLLSVGGIVAVDDLQMPAVNKAVRHVLTYPCYRVLQPAQDHARRERSGKRKLLEAAASLVPTTALSRRLLDNSFLVPDSAIGLDVEMVFLQKTKPDDRAWNWHAPF